MATRLHSALILITLIAAGKSTFNHDDLHHAILEIDTDKDSHIQLHELFILVKEMHNEVLKEELEEIFKEVDHNSDGDVTWNEYIYSYVKQTENDISLDIDKANFSTVSDTKFEIDQLIFEAADKDWSRGLDFYEFFLFVYPEKENWMLELLHKKCLLKYDLNKDLKISFVEFIDKKKYDIDTTRYIETYIHLFNDVYDKNKNGELDENEIMDWILPNWNWTEIVEKSVRKLFSRITANPFTGATYGEIRDNLRVIAKVAVKMQNVKLHDEL